MKTLTTHSADQDKVWKRIVNKTFASLKMKHHTVGGAVNSLDITNKNSYNAKVTSFWVRSEELVTQFSVFAKA